MVKIMENPIKKWMIFGGKPTIFGNTHILQLEMDVFSWFHLPSLRVPIYHPLGFHWHPLEGAGTVYVMDIFFLKKKKRKIPLHFLRPRLGPRGGRRPKFPVSSAEVQKAQSHVTVGWATWGLRETP